MLCPLGMSLVVVYQQSPTSLIDDPKGRRGWAPSPGALTMLTWGPQWKQPHARGSRLDVHTELFVYVGASRHSCQFFINAEAPWGGGGGGDITT